MWGGSSEESQSQHLILAAQPDFLGQNMVKSGCKSQKEGLSFCLQYADEGAGVISQTYDKGCHTAVKQTLQSKGTRIQAEQPEADL